MRAGPYFHPEREAQVREGLLDGGARARARRALRHSRSRLAPPGRGRALPVLEGARVARLPAGDGARARRHAAHLGSHKARFRARARPRHARAALRLAVQGALPAADGRVERLDPASGALFARTALFIHQFSPDTCSSLSLVVT